jgi:MFS family permease
MTPGEAGNWIALLSLIAGVGTFLGGVAADQLSSRTKDRRWVPVGTGHRHAAVRAVSVPHLSVGRSRSGIPSFVGLMFMAAMFFGPSFAMTQALATLRMRSVATSLLLFIQTLIGYGLGPSITGLISDQLRPAYQQNSLRYALVIIGVVNVWAAVHYHLSSRTVRQDLEATEKLATA